ncbi:IS1096 element passenger TnpR family protein [Pseudarthrobacter sp. MDT1-22]
MEYKYDFGDSWTHHVEVFGSADLPAGELLCVDGPNRGPVEDFGGPRGYQRLLQIVADPEHPEHPEHADAPCWPPGLSPGPAIPSRTSGSATSTAWCV